MEIAVVNGIPAETRRALARFLPVLLALAFPPLTRAARWDGPYVGADGGYAWGQASTHINGDSDDDGVFGSGGGSIGEPPDGIFNEQLHGAVYGGYFGYESSLWRNLYLGAEAGYAHGNIYAQALNPVQSVDFPGSLLSYKTYVDTLVSATPQLGLAWGPLLLRAKGGVAGGHVVSRFWSSASYQGLPVPTTFNENETRLGWTWGGGLDYAVSAHWFLGAEFDYYDFGRMDFGGSSTPDSNYPLSYVIHPIVRSVTARLGYRFGGPQSESVPRIDESFETPVPEEPEPPTEPGPPPAETDTTPQPQSPLAEADQFFEEGHNTEAWNAYMAAIPSLAKDDPLRARASDRLGRIALERGDCPKAVQYFRAVLRFEQRLQLDDVAGTDAASGLKECGKP